MSAALAPLPGFCESHSSLASFYAANPRRWASREVDLGLRWRGPGRRTFRAAFVEETGELYVFEHQRSDGGGGMVFVHERVSADWANDATFDGWELVCGEEDSFDWLVSRANEHAVRCAEVLEQPIARRADRLVLVVNGRASGIEDPHGTARELAALLAEHDLTADAVVTGSEQELWDELRAAASHGRRVVLVGGDGTLHSAANAPVPRLPELALVPAGRANNIARALGIPTDRMAALAVAANMPARPLDALRVATPERSLYALESVSAGFQAEARAAYDAENSADLRQGLRALVGALRRFRPHAAVVRLPDGEMRSRSTAQLFLSNLPYFGFGFHVAPGADPADGRFEAILMEARGRRRLLRLLVAARRGRHLGRRGVRRVRATRARLTEALPLVADALPLGTTTATVTVEPARLLLASPAPGAAA